MGIESYNFLLFVSGNTCVLEEEGWDIEGNQFLSFSAFQSTLAELIGVRECDKNLQPCHHNCYLNYEDDYCILEFELNAGEYEEWIQMASMRFAVCNALDNFEKAIFILQQLAVQLPVCVLDMRLGEVLDFTDRDSIARSRNCYRKKRREFFEFLKLKESSFIKPLHCGAETFSYIRSL